MAVDRGVCVGCGCGLCGPVNATVSEPCAEGRRILDRAWDMAMPMTYAPGLPNTARMLIRLGCPVDDCLNTDNPDTT